MKIKQCNFLLCTILFLSFSAPSFSAERVTADDFGNTWPFPNDKLGLLYCKELGGGRKAVWFNGKATYALNGPAMDWLIGANLTGSDGGSVRKGRDFAKNHIGLHQLIQDGLKLCN